MIPVPFFTLIPADAKPACDGDWWPYDALIDHKPNSREWLKARDECRAICATCPVFALCMETFKDEDWARGIKGTSAFRKCSIERLRAPPQGERMVRRPLQAVAPTTRAEVRRQGL